MFSSQLESIGTCMGMPPTDLYQETTTNKSQSGQHSSSAAADGTDPDSSAAGRVFASSAFAGVAAAVVALAGLL